MIYVLSLVLCCFTSRAFASIPRERCWADICHNKVISIERMKSMFLQKLDELRPHTTTSDLKSSVPQCLITSIQRGKDCVNLRFENLGHTPLVGESLGKFRLSAYVKDFGEFRGRTTAFNLSISDVKFDRLITRYQDSTDDRHAACREIEIYGKNDEISFPELFVSCAFADETFEAIPYRLEYLAVGKSFEYSRKLVFLVPRHMSIDKHTNDVRTYKLFLYVDVSKFAILSLHIQPVPQEFNVTLYRVWLINNDTNSAVSMNLKLNEEGEIQHNFSVAEGVHYFKVAAVHPLCGENGCLNSTSPAISTKQPTRRLLIMIISVVWIPPVILYSMYHAYKLYKKNLLAKQHRRRMNCLLVYSPTHGAHVHVMEKLALYMRSCDINAMIDMLDIPETANKDPGLWCNSAFQDADVIVVATSPQPSDVDVPVIYRNMDNHALRLLKENYSRRNKRYFVVQFPYCKSTDLPEEARLFRRFEMPQELDKLVRNIYAVDRVRFFGVSSKELTDAIKYASSEIPRRKFNEPNISNETDHNIQRQFSDEFLPPEIKRKTVKVEHDKNEMQDVHDEKDYFSTKIDELNLLGENGEDDTFIQTTPKSMTEFRIDRLDL